MALYVLLLAFGLTQALSTGGDLAFTNITRFNLAGGDLFSIPGTDCGPTKCMEISQGTALSTMGAGGDCVCQCHKDTPAFREDQRMCVNNIDECQMASFGRGAARLQIPFVFLPLKGQIIYPSKEIVFSDVDDAICLVTSAQYLTPTGWVTLRDVIDNDVPFGLYRDEGKTFLQWRGSNTLHSRLEGRLVATHVLCSSQSPVRLVTSCAAFRVAGTSRNSLLDVRSIPFHAGEIVSSELASPNQGLTVLESLAIGVCVLMLIFVYAAGIVFYVHYKQRQKRKDKDPEQNRGGSKTNSDNSSNQETRIDIDNVRLKTNPLLGLNALGTDFLNDSGGLSDVSERTEETFDSSPQNTQKFQKVSTNVISAIVHTRRKKPSRPSIRSATPDMSERINRRSASPDLERAPHSDLSIIDCSLENNLEEENPTDSANNEPALRKKLYFNPVFFETEHLKNPPPAAIDFLVKIREVMTIAKEKMTSKRFIPNLSDIPEEDLYHSIDLGWNIPCARQGRRFSAISLKRENSRRAVHCGGCPGCDGNAREQKVTLVRSNSCKSCVSDDYKQRIVRKWLDENPTPVKTHTKPVKSVAKVSGTPRIIEPKTKEETLPAVNSSVHERMENSRAKSNTDCIPKDKKLPSQIIEDLRKLDIQVIQNETVDKNIKLMPIYVTQDTSNNNVVIRNTNHATRKIRKKLPPPPPPPIEISEHQQPEEADAIPDEIKMKMQAVIKELNKCRRNEPAGIEKIKCETVAPIAPKIVIPVIAADSQYYSDDNMLAENRKRNLQLQNEKLMENNQNGSLLKMRRFSVACGPDINNMQNDTLESKIYSFQGKNTSRSWRDVRKALEGSHHDQNNNLSNKSNGVQIGEIFVNNTTEPMYGNLNPKPGPLTIQVRGSPVEKRRHADQFDPDTLDRKPKSVDKKRVDKILLKSGGSFKYKSVVQNDFEGKSHGEPEFNRKIGSLRQIYEAKAKAQENDIRYHRGIYERRGSSATSYDSDDIAAFLKSVKTPDLLRQTEPQKPPVPTKQRRFSDACFTNVLRESPPGDRKERVVSYNKNENLNARRSGRRSTRTRSRRTDLRKLTKTEDSGYLSTDSNESRRRASYLMQFKSRHIQEPTKTVPASITPIPKVHLPSLKHMESDTDELESLGDGQSESGGESIETDSVFFGHFDESKQMLADLGMNVFEHQKNIMSDDQIDSGFLGETNIVLSGDSDSEHRSVISIVAGSDGRASSASISKLDELSYMHTVEC